MTAEELIEEINELILSGGRRTTASNVRQLSNEFVSSFLNKEDGGLVIDVLTGYSSDLTPTDDKHFTPKKYVDDLFNSINEWGEISGDISNQTDLINYISNADDAVLTTANAYTDSEIAGIDLTTLWNIAGNTLAARGTFGNIGGTPYGWDEYIDTTTIVRGVSNSGEHYFGINGAYTDTSYTLRSLGNTSGTIHSSFADVDDNVLFGINNGYSYATSVPLAYFNGAIAIGTSSLFGQFGATTIDTGAFVKDRISLYLSGSSEYINIEKSDNTRYLIGFNRNLSGADYPFVDDVSIEASISGDKGLKFFYTNIATTGVNTRVAGYDENFNWYIGSAPSTGGGSGIFFQQNAITGAASDPVGGAITEVIDGAVFIKLPTGEYICVAGRTISQSGNYTQLKGDAILKYTGTGGHTFTLLSAASYKGTTIIISNQGTGNLSANSSTFAPGSNTLLYSDGTNWI